MVCLQSNQLSFSFVPFVLKWSTQLSWLAYNKCWCDQYEKELPGCSPISCSRWLPLPEPGSAGVVFLFKDNFWESAISWHDCVAQFLDAHSCCCYSSNDIKTLTGIWEIKVNPCSSMNSCCVSSAASVAIWPGCVQFYISPFHCSVRFPWLARENPLLAS